MSANKPFFVGVVAAAIVAGALATLFCACDNPVTSEEVQQPPRNLQASFTGAAVKLSWEPSERNEETGYEVWRKGVGGKYERIATTAKSERKYNDKEVAKGEYYDYMVRTIYVNDPGKYSREVEVYTGYLWVAESGYDLIYKLNPANCSVVGSFASPAEMFPTGLTWDGVYLWHAESYPNYRIFKLDPKTGSVLRFFKAPALGPRGLAYDGTYLWSADSDVGKIFKINIATGSVVRSFPSPGSRPDGLTWSGNYLWNADYYGDTIFKINANTGSVVASFASPTSDPTGMAWDGTYLWNAEHEKGALHKLNPYTGSPVASFAAPVRYPEGLAVEK